MVLKKMFVNIGLFFLVALVGVTCYFLYKYYKKQDNIANNKIDNILNELNNRDSIVMNKTFYRVYLKGLDTLPIAQYNNADEAKNLTNIVEYMLRRESLVRMERTTIIINNTNKYFVPIGVFKNIDINVCKRNLLFLKHKRRKDLNMYSLGPFKDINSAQTIANFIGINKKFIIHNH